MARPIQEPVPPAIVPTDADWQRAATIFELRARTAVIQNVIHVIVTGKPTDPKPRWLQERFGGAVYAYGVQQRWQIAREAMIDFLSGIEPLLVEEQAKELLDQIYDTDNALTALQMRKRMAKTAALATASGEQPPVIKKPEIYQLWAEEFDGDMAQAAYDGILRKGVVTWFETGEAVAP